MSEHLVPAEAATEFLDTYVSRVFPEFPSRNSARKAAKRGEILVDGVVADRETIIRPGQRVSVLASTRTAPPELRIPLPVIFEDRWFAVIDKPPGLTVMGNRSKTVERALGANLERSTEPDALPWPKPVHRLDAPTGGLLLVAKCRRAQIALGQALETREIRKRYRALLIGRLEGEGTVEQPIEGRDALTLYRAVEHTRAMKGEWVTTVDLWPLTGRTHQLRRHMASLGHPVLGDELYGAPGLVLRGKGLYLAALELLLPHPISGEPLWVAMREPHKFESFRSRETRRWQRAHG